MSDVFDNSEEKKAQIAQIAETKQKAILCQGKPSGIYRFLQTGWSRKLSGNHFESRI